MSGTVRDMEREWLESAPKGEKGPIPEPVRAMWFLSSVIVGYRRWYSKTLHKATGDDGSVDDVKAGLTLVYEKGRVARILLAEIDGDHTSDFAALVAADSLTKNGEGDG